MSTQDEMRRLAALTWLGEKISKEAAATKARIAADVGEGGRAVARAGDEILGTLSASKPRQGAPRIVDVELAISWLDDNFGLDGMVSMQLTDQGKKTLMAAALRGEVPGMEIPPPGKSALMFKLSAEADDLVPAMLRSGVLSTADILGIEAL